MEVLEASPGRPVSGERLVRAPTARSRSASTARIYVAGLSTTEIKEKIVLHLRKFLPEEVLGLVEQDEKGNWIEIEPKDSNRVFVDVTAYNSKNYYIQGDVAAPGKLPITVLNETGARSPSTARRRPDSDRRALKNIRLVRPARPLGACCEQVLPVNLSAIISGGDPTTNYQLMPGDRLVVYRDPIVRATLFIDRLAAPFQTVLNSMLQFSFTDRSIKSLSIPLLGGAGTTTTPWNRNLCTHPSAGSTLI